jgi:hypothetical protein
MDIKTIKPSQTIFALLFPFWTVIASIKFFKSPSARNLFWYGCIFMGYVHIFNPLGGSASDGVRYAEELVKMNSEHLNFKTLTSYFYSENGNLDIYQPLITLLVSFFTKNPHFLFLIFAIVFGFFYSRNIWLVLNFSNNDKLSWWSLIILIMLILVMPIWEINGVRMWTALHVFMYGVLSFYLNNDKKKLVWSFAAVLIHFSFSFPLMLIFIYIFLPKNNLTIYFVLFFISATFNEINIQALNDVFVKFLPVQLSTRTESYLNEDYLISVNETSASYAQYLIIAQKLSKYFILAIIIFFWTNRNTLFTKKLYQNLLTLFLYLSAWFQFFSMVPSIGRFFAITNMIFFSLLFIMLVNERQDNSKLNNLTKYLSIMLLMPMLLKFRLGCEFYGNSLFWSNFISSSFFEDRTPIIDYIKSLF